MWAVRTIQKIVDKFPDFRNAEKKIGKKRGQTTPSSLTSAIHIFRSTNTLTNTNMTDINPFSALIAAASYEREGLGGGCMSMRLPPPLPFFATATSNFIDGKFIKTPKRASAI